MNDYVNANGYRFHNGLVIAPAPAQPTDTVHRFDPRTDEPQHANDTRPEHAPFAHVMETLVEPESCTFRYQPGMYVYVHHHAYETNGLDALECCIDDVTNAPLEIVVTPCNHPEQQMIVSQDKLSAPIWV